MAAKSDSPNLYTYATNFAVLKTHSPNLYRLSTCFAVVKTDSPNHYKDATHIAVTKADTPNLYTPHTRTVVDKTESPNLYRSATSFSVHKSDSLIMHLHGSYTAPTQFGVIETNSANLCGSAGRSKRTVRTSIGLLYTIAVLKTDSLNTYRQATL